MRQRAGTAVPDAATPRSGRDFQRAAQLAAGANLELAHALARRHVRCFGRDRSAGRRGRRSCSPTQDGAFEDGKTWLRNCRCGVLGGAVRAGPGVATRRRGHVRAEPAERGGGVASRRRLRLRPRRRRRPDASRPPLEQPRHEVPCADRFSCRTGDHAPRPGPSRPRGVAHTAWTPTSEVAVGGSCPCHAATAQADSHRDRRLPTLAPGATWLAWLVD